MGNSQTKCSLRDTATAAQYRRLLSQSGTDCLSEYLSLRSGVKLGVQGEDSLPFAARAALVSKQRERRHRENRETLTVYSRIT